MTDPLVSIIMPAYNAAAFIKEAITSVSAQTYQNWELIVINDGSTDDTANIVKELQSTDSRIIYFHQTNHGLGAARNAGLKAANGDWIAFLDADDLWHPDKLSLQMLTAEAKGADVIYSQGEYLYETQAELKPYNSLTGKYDHKAMYQKLIGHNHLPVLSVCLKKEVVKVVGVQGTLPIIKGNEDWDYWLRVCKAGYSFYGMPERLFTYRVHGTNMSANKTAMRIASLYVQVKNYSASLLDKRAIHIFKVNLIASVPFMFKNVFKSRMVGGTSILLLKMLTISRTLLPGFILGKIKHRLTTTTVLER